MGHDMMFEHQNGWIKRKDPKTIKTEAIPTTIHLWWWGWRLSSQVVSNSCDPMDCGPPGSSVLGILQARRLEWAAISFSRGSFTPRNQTRVSRTAGRFFTDWAMRESLRGALTPNTKHIHTSAHFPFTPLTSLHPTQVAIQCTLSLNMALWQSSVVK